MLGGRNSLRAALKPKRRRSIHRRMVLLRAGRTPWDHERRVTGRHDPPLDRVGEQQAADAAAELAALEPALIITSDLRRARQTVARLERATDQAALVDKRFDEVGLGGWEGLTLEDVGIRYPDEYDRWRTGGRLHRTGGEPEDEAIARLVAAVANAACLTAPGDTFVVVTHDTAIALLMHALVGSPRNRVLDNGAWRTLVDVDGAVRTWRA